MLGPLCNQTVNLTYLWGVISANIINFQILLCHSPIMLFSFLIFLIRNFMQFRILLFPFEFCYSFFWFYYAIMNSLIQFPILLLAFELCSSKSGTSFTWRRRPGNQQQIDFPSIEKHGGLGRRRFAESSLHKCNSNLIHQILTLIVTILYSTAL